jgi:hypothetical protein
MNIKLETLDISSDDLKSVIILFTELNPRLHSAVAQGNVEIVITNGNRDVSCTPGLSAKSLFP